MQNVYFISGLGADKRAFQFLDLSFCNPIFVEWIRPHKDETIGCYATRLREQIMDEEPVIVGLSFGGMVAIEIARQYPIKKLILLSSAKTEKEIPYYLRCMRYLPLHKAFPTSVLRTANQFAHRLMRIHQREDKIIVTKMLHDADDRFISWAINQIIHWKNRHVIPNTYHIHGTADIVLPYRFIKANHTVKGGEHTMLMMQGNAISKLLSQIIAPNHSI